MYLDFGRSDVEKNNNKHTYLFRCRTFDLHDVRVIATNFPGKSLSRYRQE